MTVDFNPSELKLVPRTINALKTNGVSSMDKFLTLTKEQVMGWKNCGHLTWRNIEECRAGLGEGGSSVLRPIQAHHFNSMKEVAEHVIALRDLHQAISDGLYCDGDVLERLLNRDDFSEIDSKSHERVVGIIYDCVLDVLAELEAYYAGMGFCVVEESQGLTDD